MLIINSRVRTTASDLDRRAVAEAAERTGLERDDVRAAVVAYLNAVERQEETRKEFEMNGQDRW